MAALPVVHKSTSPPSLLALAFIKELSCSNIPPNDEQVAILRPAYAAAIEDHVALSKKINRFVGPPSLMHRYTLGREEVLQLMFSYKSILSPIRRLNYESALLRIIFHYFLDDSDPETLRVTRGIWTLSRVCSAWRSVAISHAPFWSTVFIDLRYMWPSITDLQQSEMALQYVKHLTSALDIYLERSGDEKLRVFFTLKRFPKGHLWLNILMRSLLECLVAHCHRWQFAMVTIPRTRGRFMATLRKITGNVPVLEAFLLDFCEDEVEWFGRFWGSHLPDPYTNRVHFYQLPFYDEGNESSPIDPKHAQTTSPQPAISHHPESQEHLMISEGAAQASSYDDTQAPLYHLPFYEGGDYSKSVEVTDEYDGHPLDVISIAPRLRCFASNALHMAAAPIPWTQLTTYYGTEHSREEGGHLAVLRRLCDTLINCTLSGKISRIEDPSVPPVILPHLRKLHLKSQGSGTILDHLVTPALQSLELYPYDSGRLEPARELLIRSSCSLEALTLHSSAQNCYERNDQWPMMPSLISDYDGFSSLTRLKIGTSRYQALFFEQLTVCEGEVPLLPNLEVLDIEATIIPAKSFKCKTLLDVWVSRRGEQEMQNVKSLQIFTFAGRVDGSCLDDDYLDPAVEAAIEKLEGQGISTLGVDIMFLPRPPIDYDIM